MWFANESVTDAGILIPSRWKEAGPSDRPFHWPAWLHHVQTNTLAGWIPQRKDRPSKVNLARVEIAYRACLSTLTTPQPSFRIAETGQSQTTRPRSPRRRTAARSAGASAPTTAAPPPRSAAFIAPPRGGRVSHRFTPSISKRIILTRIRPSASAGCLAR